MSTHTHTPNVHPQKKCLPCLDCAIHIYGYLKHTQAIRTKKGLGVVGIGAGGHVMISRAHTIYEIVSFLIERGGGVRVNQMEREGEGGEERKTKTVNVRILSACTGERAASGPGEGRKRGACVCQANGEPNKGKIKRRKGHIVTFRFFFTSCSCLSPFRVSVLGSLRFWLLSHMHKPSL